MCTMQILLCNKGIATYFRPKTLQSYLTYCSSFMTLVKFGLSRLLLSDRQVH